MLKPSRNVGEALLRGRKVKSNTAIRLFGVMARPMCKLYAKESTKNPTKHSKNAKVSNKHSMTNQWSWLNSIFFKEIKSPASEP